MVQLVESPREDTADTGSISFVNSDDFAYVVDPIYEDGSNIPSKWSASHVLGYSQALLIVGALMFVGVLVGGALLAVTFRESGLPDASATDLAVTPPSPALAAPAASSLIPTEAPVDTAVPAPAFGDFRTTPWLRPRVRVRGGTAAVSPNDPPSFFPNIPTAAPSDSPSAGAPSSGGGGGVVDPSPTTSPVTNPPTTQPPTTSPPTTEPPTTSPPTTEPPPPDDPPPSDPPPEEPPPILDILLNAG